MPMNAEEESWLDRVLADSFPASDPFSPHQVRPADRRKRGAPEPHNGAPSGDRNRADVPPPDEAARPSPTIKRSI